MRWPLDERADRESRYGGRAGYITDTWIKLGVPKESAESSCHRCCLVRLNLTPIEVAQAFQTIASGGNRAPLSAVRSVIAEDGSVLYQSFPQAERVIPAQASYLTLYTMQQVVITKGHRARWRTNFLTLHLAAKTGTTNELVTAGLPVSMAKKWRSPGWA